MTALRIIALGFIVSSVGVVYCGVFEGLGRGKESLIISLLRQFVITLPLGVLLSQVLGPVGIWLAFPVAELIASVAAVLLFRKIS